MTVALSTFAARARSIARSEVPERKCADAFVMPLKLRNLQHKSRAFLAQLVNDGGASGRYRQRMNSVVRIHTSKQGNRPHFIAEWAEKRNLSQADLARELSADKSIVSRWFGGSSPTTEYQEKLAALFACDDRDAIFRHPDDDWLVRFFKGRNQDEIERIKKMLEIAFPRKSA